MPDERLASRIAEDLHSVGVTPGSLIMVHSSLKSLGPHGVTPEDVVLGLIEAIGPSGTLLMPALSFEQEPHHVHSTIDTPSNVGVIPEYFRLRPGTVRSVHPTHSVCGVGPAVAGLFARHGLDSTPCGPGSPFRAILEREASIVMLGCGLDPNTTMHAIEEFVAPPYLYGDECDYTITTAAGDRYTKRYRCHGFVGWAQRYDRITQYDTGGMIASGTVLDARVHVVDTRRLAAAALAALRDDPLAFVEETGPEFVD